MGEKAARAPADGTARRGGPAAPPPPAACAEQCAPPLACGPAGAETAGHLGTWAAMPHCRLPTAVKGEHTHSWVGLQLQLPAHLRLRLLQLPLVLAADGRRLLWQLQRRPCRGISEWLIPRSFPLVADEKAWATASQLCIARWKERSAGSPPDRRSMSAAASSPASCALSACRRCRSASARCNSSSYRLNRGARGECCSQARHLQAAREGRVECPQALRSEVRLAAQRSAKSSA